MFCSPLINDQKQTTEGCLTSYKQPVEQELGEKLRQLGDQK